MSKTNDPLSPTLEQVMTALQKPGIADLAQLAALATQPSDTGEVAKWAFIVKGKFIFKDDSPSPETAAMAQAPLQPEAPVATP